MGKRVAIIGGGLAGTACAYTLKEQDYEPVIFEAGAALGSGASGNPTALYNSRFYAEKIPEALFYGDAYLSVCKLFQEFGERIDHSPHGSLHLITSEDKKRRFSKMLDSWEWPEDEMRLVSSKQATEIAGIEITHEALFLPNSGTVSPVKLCQVYVAGCEVRLNTPITNLIQAGEKWEVNGEAFDIVILACGYGVKQFQMSKWLLVHTVRGQIAQFAETENSKTLKTNLNFGGYITPSKNGLHTCGSTFQKWLAHTDILAEDNAYIQRQLAKAIPVLDHIGDVQKARASLRTSSQDRLPIIGSLPNMRNVYISAAHGSHGVITSFSAAKMILQEIEKQNCCYAAKLHADRFLKRGKIKMR